MISHDICKLFVGPESELTVTHLLDPVTGSHSIPGYSIGKEACYLFDDGSFLETTRIEDDPSSWFVNDQVIQGID